VSLTLGLRKPESAGHLLRRLSFYPGQFYFAALNQRMFPLDLMNVICASHPLSTASQRNASLQRCCLVYSSCRRYKRTTETRPFRYHILSHCRTTFLCQRDGHVTPDQLRVKEESTLHHCRILIKMKIANNSE
jgi:hypothetical protein